MPENTRLSSNIDQIDLEVIEREATPRFLMEFSIQLHLAELSLSNTVSVLEKFGVERTRSTVHGWVHKADLQPETGHSSDNVAVEETVIRIDDEQYWLYAAVDPDSNELLYTKHEPTRTNALAHAFSAELCEKHDVENAVFLVDGATPLKDACSRHGLDFRYQKTWKCEKRRTCLSRGTTTNFLVLKLF